jgi:hypothetical protein
MTRSMRLAMAAAMPAVFVATWWLASRGSAGPTAQAVRAAPSDEARRVPPTPEHEPVPAAAPASTPADAPGDVTPAVVAQWIADTQHANAATRAQAIASLARGPRADAIPALRRVLIGGEPGVDRPLALRALRELALSQGDADGQIRAAVREVIYHGDDQVPPAAQETLDAIENAQSAPSASQR